MKWNMDWVKPEFSDFLCPPRKKQKIENPIEKVSIPQSRSNFSRNGAVSTKLNLVGKYCPQNKDELVVNKKKIEELEYWLKNLSKESTYLLLTGPSGCGKLRTLCVLCKSLKIDVVEWTSPFSHHYDPESFNAFYQSELDAFEEFIMRASRYSNVLTQSSDRVIIVKDIPNGFIRNNDLFHTLLEHYYGIEKIRIVFIISEFSICRDLFPENVKIKFFVKNINFNSITQRNVSTALQTLAKKFNLNEINSNLGSHIEKISFECNGDLRNAITTFQFLLVKGNLENVHITTIPKKKKAKGTKSTKGPDLGSSSNTISDNKIDIFHGLGRILYAKKENGKFIHNPQDVADSFTSCPQLLISMLHENYFNTFSSIHDISKASVNLAVSDILLHYSDLNTSIQGCGVSVASHGVMTVNSNPLKKFQQFNKGRSPKESMVLEYKGLLESSNPLWKGTDILMDIAPFMKMLPNIELPHKDILLKLGKYS